MLLLLTLLLSPGLAQDAPEAPAEDAPAELPIVQGPQILEYVEAPYPDAAREEGLEGTVLLRVELDEAGAVVSVEVAEPVGHGFDEAALAAVQAMRFSPAATETGPVPVIFEFAYGFTLQPEEPAVAAPPPVTLEGRVREMGTRRPVEGARVVAAGVEGETDADGHFSLRGVPPGDHPVRVLKPGYVTAETSLEVVEGEVTSAELWIRAESYRENESVALYHRVKEEVTRRTLTIEEVRKVPGTFGDPVKVVQTLPGAARSPFGTGLLVIRGANPEDTGVYVDGIRIPIIYHLTGTTSVISPELVEAVDYYPGGYGVQYGRSMGGAVEARTRTDFDASRLLWSTDILDTQLWYEAKVGPEGRQHGLAIGARASYIHALLPYFVQSEFTISPRYWDYQAKWVPPERDERDLSVLVYGFQDVLTVSSPEDTAQGPDQDTQGDLGTRYLSHRVILNYRRDLSETVSLELTPSLGYDGGGFGLGEEFALDNRTVMSWIRAEVPWQVHPHLELAPGMDFVGAWWTFDFKSAFSYTDLDDPFAEREPISFDGRGTTWSPDLYLKSAWRPLQDPEDLLIGAGVRLNTIAYVYSGGVTGDGASDAWGRLSVDPRVHVRWRPVTPLTLKASTGLYQQIPQPQESIGTGTTVELGFERSWASSIGVEHQLTDVIHWDLELFHRDLSNLIVFNEDWGGFGEHPFINEGRGRAYGLEVIARHDKRDRFFGWVSYTLSKAERQDHPGDDWYTFDLDQTHILSAQGGYDLPYDLSVSAQVQYVTGNPDTPYNAGVVDLDSGFYSGFPTGSYNSQRLPPFFQTSLRVDKLWTLRRWQLTTYVDLLNIVRGVNPELRVYDYDYTNSAYVRGLPFIPNVGIEATFRP